MFKRGEISGCDTAIAINTDVIIPIPQGFMLGGSVIQEIYVFQFIMNIVSCQETFPIMVLLEDLLEEETIKAVTWIINICQISLS